MLGMDIGLPIRKAVVDTHKGRIDGHNADGRQTTEPLAPEIGRKLSRNNSNF
jgi:nitrogen fixation/metabolism regulation signal transduction histidine kinase